MGCMTDAELQELRSERLEEHEQTQQQLQDKEQELASLQAHAMHRISISATVGIGSRSSHHCRLMLCIGLVLVPLSV